MVNSPARKLIVTLSALMLLIGFSAWQTPSPAQALSGPVTSEAPFDFTSAHVTDKAGVLSSPIRKEAENSIDSGAPELYIVFVDSFGSAGGRWADAAVDSAGLSSSAVTLVAIAVEDRQVSIRSGGGSRLGSSEVDALRQGITPALSTAANSGDWDDVPQEVLTNYLSLAEGAGNPGPGSADYAPPVDSPQSPESSATRAGGLLVLLLIIAGVVTVAILVRKHKQAGAASGQLDPQSLAKLNQQAGAELVAADDAVRTSAEELEFARAQFGVVATDQFDAALQQAKRLLDPAFELRKQLDDEYPETPAQQQQMCQQILAYTEQIRGILAGQKEAFANLRKQQANLGESLSLMKERVSELEGQVKVAEEQMVTLHRTYPHTSLDSLDPNPQQAQGLLTAARQTLEQIDPEDKATAMTKLELAGRTVAQAKSLLDAVAAAPEKLADMTRRLQEAMNSISADLTDVQRLAPNDPAVATPAQAAREALDAAGKAAQGNGDPLAALTRLGKAEEALDAALEPWREAADVRNKQAANVRSRLDVLDGQISTLNQFVNTRRGAIGSAARSALAMAEQSAGRARAHLQGNNPAAAMQELSVAESSLQQANNLIRQDMDNSQNNFGARGGGGFDFGSLLLGGLLLGQMFGGGSNHSSGWSSFGGGFGGFGGGGFSSGGFGGFGGGGSSSGGF